MNGVIPLVLQRCTLQRSPVVREAAMRALVPLVSLISLLAFFMLVMAGCSGLPG